MCRVLRNEVSLRLGESVEIEIKIAAQIKLQSASWET